MFAGPDLSFEEWVNVSNSKSVFPQTNIAFVFRIEQWKNNGFTLAKFVIFACFIKSYILIIDPISVPPSNMTITIFIFRNASHFWSLWNQCIRKCFNIGFHFLYFAGFFLICVGKTFCFFLYRSFPLKFSFPKLCIAILQIAS